MFVYVFAPMGHILAAVNLKLLLDFRNYLIKDINWILSKTLKYSEYLGVHYIVLRMKIGQNILGIP